MTVKPGQAIENESFRIIREEMGPHSFSAAEEAVAVRVIHATADFDFVDTLRFSPGAVAAGVDALRGGCAIVTDVHMIEAGVSARLLGRVGGAIHCAIDAPAVYARAEQESTTRAVAAMRELAPHIDGGIVAIGNAPTALYEVIRLMDEEAIRPALIVGVPVGFVSAVESKDALAGLDVPHITALGRKGGSTVAVAAINAMLRLALES
jgi:precorrin-8X/cobalt-precorrin-8 methylmutase